MSVRPATDIDSIFASTSLADNGNRSAIRDNQVKRSAQFKAKSGGAASAQQLRREKFLENQKRKRLDRFAWSRGLNVDIGTSLTPEKENTPKKQNEIPPVTDSTPLQECEKDVIVVDASKDVAATRVDADVSPESSATPSADSMDCGSEDVAASAGKHSTKRKHKNEVRAMKDKLMLSEWMREVPGDLQENWSFVVCPKGTHAL